MTVTETMIPAIINEAQTAAYEAADKFFKETLVGKMLMLVVLPGLTFMVLK